MRTIVKSILLIQVLLLVACTAHQDLNAPCPDFGRYCPQTPVNAWDNDEKQQ